MTCQAGPKIYFFLSPSMGYVCMNIAGPYIGVSPAQSILPATDKVVSLDMYNNVTS